jgi:hypothetical protein
LTSVLALLTGLQLRRTSPPLIRSAILPRAMRKPVGVGAGGVSTEQGAGKAAGQQAGRQQASSLTRISIAPSIRSAILPRAMRRPVEGGVPAQSAQLAQLAQSAQSAQLAQSAQGRQQGRTQSRRHQQASIHKHLRCRADAALELAVRSKAAKG